MTEKTASTPAIRILDNLFGGEVYADSAVAFGNKGGLASITFTSIRFDNGGNMEEPVQVVVGRLVMPVQGAQNLAIGLFNWLKEHHSLPAEISSAAN